MTDDPSLALQAAIVALLRESPAVSALVGSRVYDRVPADAKMPYVALTGWQTITEDGECFDAYEIYFDAQCFSDAVGRPEVARLAGAVRTALHKAVVATGDAAISHNNTLYFVDDGLIQRAVVNFRALVD